MQLDAVLKFLEATSVATAISENDALFPWIESLHVLAITLVVGSIWIVDLRLLGIGSRDRALTPLAKEVLPCTWAAFVLAAGTGILLFISKAVTYGHNVFFLGKMGLLAAAGVNMVVFHLLIARDVERWGATPYTTPLGARIAGGLSLCLWIAVVAFGRWIGFTLQAHPGS